MNVRFRESVGSVLHRVAILVTLAVILFPLYWMVAGSLKTQSELFSIPPVWVWRPTLAAYAEALSDSGLIIALRNSLVVTVLGVALGLVAGVPAAYGIARYRFRGREQI
ncbi:MAG TPA: hypothetical protein VFS39_08390, partial [Nitrospira sp.]|nr:hypothetical protein [Nitrospira sp.]